MKKPTFLAACPCCGEKLLVDTRLRRLDAADKTKAKRSDVLDRADDVLDNDDSRRKDSFDRAFDEETGGKKPSLDDFL